MIYIGILIWKKYVGVTSTISEICGGGRIQIERQSLHME